MASDFSFDIVSDYDRQELVNAIDQTVREVRTRFDLKDTGSTITLESDRLQLTSASEFTLGAVRDVLLQKAVKRSHATRWNAEPWVLGAFSAAAPGGQASRRVLMEPLNNRLWFAGEAVHETLWGTVGGAWESGERAADAVMRPAGGRRA